MVAGSPYVDADGLTIHVGDVRKVLAGLPDESVQCVITSPPYWGLRSYIEDGHVDKPLEIGLEPIPEQYVENMVAVFREVRRVLRKDGTCWLNIGDSYAGNNGFRPDAPSNQLRAEAIGEMDGKLRVSKRIAEGQPAGWRTLANTPGLKPKDLVGIPWRLAFALQADGWYLRSEIIWAKPNPMPESVTDRPTKSHEHVFLLTKSARYFYDADAVREPHSPDGRHKTVHDHATDNSHPNYDNIGNGHERWPNGGRNLRSVWKIATESSAEAHFATYPQALVERCVKAGTSERGACPECGAPWERETDRGVEARQVDPSEIDRYGTGEAGVHRKVGGQYQKWLDANPKVTTGWALTCRCGDEYSPVPCVVLDPFLGSGTTALVARRLGRDAVGIELSAEYAEIAGKRLAIPDVVANAAAKSDEPTQLLLG